MEITNVTHLGINLLTEAQYQAAKQAGTLNPNELYLTEDNGDGGNSFTKEETLTAATAALYGLGSSAVPNDVLAMLPNMINNRAKIATGSYVGTGTSGSSNANSLHFDFVPNLLFISKAEYSVNSNDRFTSTVFGSCDYFSLLPYEPLLTYNELGDGHKSKTLNFRVNNGSTTPGTNVYTISDGGKTLTWYNGSGPYSQLNESGKTYYWIAIG